MQPLTTQSTPTHQRPPHPPWRSIRRPTVLAGVDAEAFILAMRGRTTGVNIVTTDGAGGRFGLTISSFTSVSAEPPLVLVGINRRSPVNPAIQANQCFCVSVLACDQRALADVFAGQVEPERAYDFGVARWVQDVTGAPGVERAVASFDCVLEQTIRTGTHHLFLGRVVATRRGAGDPLLYGNRAYRHTCVQD